MIENETLVDKISHHPRIWAAAGIIASLFFLVFGSLMLFAGEDVPAGDIDKAPYLAFSDITVDTRNDSEMFELKDTFCRYIPLGREYFYSVRTPEGEEIFIRAEKDWEKQVIKGEKLHCQVRRFNKLEQQYIAEGLAYDVTVYADADYVRVDALVMLAGVMLLTSTALGAVLVKGKLHKGAYKTVNLIFCALPIAAVIVSVYSLSRI